LIGPNGCGKSCLLKSLAAREVPIPNHIDIYYLDREVEASDISALDCVKSVDKERLVLEKEADQLMEQEMTPEIEQRLEDIYERYDLVTQSRSFISFILQLKEVKS
jgi:ATP-binding cassette, subfamily F, member 2